MTESDIQRIEKELGITLPDDYKAFMRSYPFQSDSIASENIMDDANWLIEATGTRHRLFPPHTFIIGTDGGESTYFLDLSRQPSPVFNFDLETRGITEESPDLQAFVNKCRESEAEVRRDEEEMERRKWWQFWK